MVEKGNLKNIWRFKIYFFLVIILCCSLEGDVFFWFILDMWVKV